jgi:hypothetical protein
VDAAFAPNKTLTTTRIDQFSKRSVLLTTPTLTGVLGASYRLTQPDLTLTAEYYHLQPILSPTDREEDVVKPVFASDLALSSTVRLGGERRWSVAGAGVIAFPDRLMFADLSALLTADVSYTASDSLSFSLAVPVFIGDPGSDFGQYRDVFTVAGTVRYRF